MPDSAPFAYDGLDRVLHERARLSLLTSLASHPKPLAFADLKQLCGLTDGNLSRHLGVLEEAGLVEIHKGYEGRRPLTTCRLTPAGRERFVAYLAVLERVVRDAAEAARQGEGEPAPRPPDPFPLFYPETLQCKALLHRKTRFTSA